MSCRVPFSRITTAVCLSVRCSRKLMWKVLRKGPEKSVGRLLDYITRLLISPPIEPHSFSSQSINHLNDRKEDWKTPLKLLKGWFPLAQYAHEIVGVYRTWFGLNKEMEKVKTEIETFQIIIFTTNGSFAELALFRLPEKATIFAENYYFDTFCLGILIIVNIRNSLFSLSLKKIKLQCKLQSIAQNSLHFS